MTEERKAELRAWQVENGKKHANNLTPLTQRSEEEARAIRSKAGKASVEARKKRRDIKSIMDDILTIKAKDLTNDETITSLSNKLESLGIEADAYTIINAVQTVKAMQGSTKSAEYVRDTSGDKPDNRISIDADITTDSDRELMQSLSNRLDSLEAIETTAKPID